MKKIARSDDLASVFFYGEIRWTKLEQNSNFVLFL
jgi:hypothetical protein